MPIPHTEIKRNSPFDELGDTNGLSTYEQTVLDATLCVSLTRDGPDIVNVLPVPVCPYAITVPLYPFSTDSTTGPATSSYTL